MKAVAIAMLLTACSVSASDIPKAVTDAQAAAEAKEAYKVALRLWDEGKLACRVDAREANRIDLETISMVRGMPTDHLKYRARFPYWACATALNDIGARMESCGPTYSTRRDVYLVEQWQKDIKACAAAIRHPQKPKPDDVPL
jgi:hypothetical protein